MRKPLIPISVDDSVPHFYRLNLGVVRLYCCTISDRLELRSTLFGRRYLHHFIVGQQLTRPCQLVTRRTRWFGAFMTVAALSIAMWLASELFPSVPALVARRHISTTLLAAGLAGSCATLFMKERVLVITTTRTFEILYRKRYEGYVRRVVEFLQSRNPGDPAKDRVA